MPVGGRRTSGSQGIRPEEPEGRGSESRPVHQEFCPTPFLPARALLKPLSKAKDRTDVVPSVRKLCPECRYSHSTRCASPHLPHLEQVGSNPSGPATTSSAVFRSLRHPAVLVGRAYPTFNYLRAGRPSSGWTPPFSGWSPPIETFHLEPSTACAFFVGDQSATGRCCIALACRRATCPILWRNPIGPLCL